jgi:hypothetical protein
MYSIVEAINTVEEGCIAYDGKIWDKKPIHI